MVRLWIKKLGERQYNIFFNNCESFVNLAITEKKSNQGDLAMGIGITAAVVGAIAIGVFTLFFGGRN